MSEVATLTGRLRALAHPTLPDLHREAADTIDALAAKVAEMEKDAARYRWLRHGDHDELVLRVNDPNGGSRLFDPRFDGVWLPRTGLLDAAIDAELAKQPLADSGDAK